MLDDSAVAEAADSTPAPTSAQADPSAGTQNTGTNGQAHEAQVPFHEHPRWQQLMRERATERQELTQLRQLAQRMQQNQSQGTQRQATPDQLEALRALRELQGFDPENGKLQQEVSQLRQQLQGLVQHQQTSLTTQGRGQLAEMAKAANLPTSPRQLAVIENAVTLYLAEKPEAVDRFRNGDVSVLKDAFAEFDKDFVSHLRRDATTQLAATKTNLVRNVPPRQTGAQSGAAAPKRLQPGQDPREFMAEAHRDADAMLSRLQR